MKKHGKTDAKILLSLEETERFKKLVEEGKTNKEILKAGFRGITKVGHVKYTKRVLYPKGLPVIKSKAEREKDEVLEQLEKIEKILWQEHRIRNNDVSRILGQNKNYTRGILAKAVQLGFLVEVPDVDKNGQQFDWYFSNKFDFYKPKELQRLIPIAEKDRILKSVRTLHGGGLVTAKELNFALYARHTEEDEYNFLETFLNFYVAKGLLKYSGSAYYLTQRGYEFGLDAQSILSLETSEIENKLTLKRETEASKLNSRDDIARVLAKDRKNKTIQPVDITNLMPINGKVRFRLMAEVLYGNSNTDEKLIDWTFTHSAEHKIRPDFSIVTGLIQGTFTGERLDKSRVLAVEGGLNTINGQFRSAGILLSDLENITKKRVFVVQSDDDWDSARSYARLLQLAEGKSWSYGVNLYSLSSELERRLNYIDYREKWRMQWDFLQAYQFRVKRSVMNRQEVDEKIGVYKTEYRLIVEILLAVGHGFAYPPIYEKVVDIHALLDVARSFINQRLARKNSFLHDLLKRLRKEENILEKQVGRKNTYVAPDSLILKNGKEELLQLIHNSNFSNITQYVDPAYTLEKVMRHLGVRGVTYPRYVFDAHQEFMYITYIHGHWVGCLAGMQNAMLEAEHRKTEFSSRILSSKSHRQSTFRKSPTTPMALDIEEVGDGRVRFHFYSNAIREVLENERGNPHERVVMLIKTDSQNGSISMQPEMEMKGTDYALYGREGGKKEELASVVVENGDVLQAFNYEAVVAENRPYRLVSLDSQQRFTIATQMPLLTQAPELTTFRAWMGNHEWNTFKVAQTGYNPLHFLEAYLQGFILGAGKRTKLASAFTVNRIRLELAEAKGLHPRGGGTINHPYFAARFAGFKMGITHMWQRRGGGRTPVDQQRRWLMNMADAASDLNILFGGHFHTFFMAGEYDKILIQLASTASQSGFELMSGLYSTVMMTVAVFDNREGFTLELVPWQFLFDEYECRSPFLKGKDKDLERPRKGTLAYKQGKMSPFVESIIDDLTLYLNV